MIGWLSLKQNGEIKIQKVLEVVEVLEIDEAPERGGEEDAALAVATET